MVKLTLKKPPFTVAIKALARSFVLTNSDLNRNILLGGGALPIKLLVIKMAALIGIEPISYTLTA